MKAAEEAGEAGPVPKALMVLGMGAVAAGRVVARRRRSGDPALDDRDSEVDHGE